MWLGISILAHVDGFAKPASPGSLVDSSGNPGNAVSMWVSGMKDMHQAFWALTLLIAVGGAAHADVVLSGPDSNDGSYSTAALAAAAGGNTVDSGGLTGISLWAFLGGAN